MNDNWFFRDSFATVQLADQVVSQAFFELPTLIIFWVDFVREYKLQSRAEYSFREHQPLEILDLESGRVEKLPVWPELNSGAGFLFCYSSNFSEFLINFAIGKINPIYPPITLNFNCESGGKSVNYGNTDSVQTSGVHVVF